MKRIRSRSGDDEGGEKKKKVNCCVDLVSGSTGADALTREGLAALVQFGK